MVMIELEVSEKPRPLPPPNFTIPFTSPTLRWARRRRLRCSNSVPSPSPDRDRGHSSSSPVRSTPACDWQKPPIRPRTPREEEEVEEGTGKGVAVVVEEEKGVGNGEGRFLRSRAAGGGGGEMKGGGRTKKKRVELWVSLSREEIEEDFYSFTGMKLPRRPKKRPRTVPVNLLDRVFPGSWLPNVISPEMYKVHEPAESRKR